MPYDAINISPHGESGRPVTVVTLHEVSNDVKRVLN